MDEEKDRMPDVSESLKDSHHISTHTKSISSHQKVDGVSNSKSISSPKSKCSPTREGKRQAKWYIKPIKIPGGMSQAKYCRASFIEAKDAFDNAIEEEIDLMKSTLKAKSSSVHPEHRQDILSVKDEVNHPGFTIGEDKKNLITPTNDIPEFTNVGTGSLNVENQTLLNRYPQL